MSDIRDFKEFYGPGVLDPDWQYVGYDPNENGAYLGEQTYPQVVNNKLYWTVGYGNNSQIADAIFYKLGDYPNSNYGYLVESNLDGTGLKPVFNTVAHINQHSAVNSNYHGTSVSVDGIMAYYSIVTGDLMWADITNGDNYGTIKAYTTAEPYTIKWSPDGNYLVWDDSDGKMWVWDGNTVTEITYYDPANEASRDATSNKGETIGDSSWVHTPNGTIGGVLVWVILDDPFYGINSVTYGGITVPSWSTGRVSAFWLANPPQGQQTISVTTNPAQVWAAAAVSFSGNDLGILNWGSVNDSNDLNPSYDYAGGTSNNACLTAAYYAGNDTALGNDANTTVISEGVITGSVGIVNEVQRIFIYNYTVGDTFKLRFDGQTTGLIARGANPTATAANIKAALEGLSSISPNTVTVTGGFSSPYYWFLVTFDNGTLAGVNVPQITCPENNGCTVNTDTWDEGYTPYNSYGFLHANSSDSSYSSQSIGTNTRTADSITLTGVAIGGINDPFFWGGNAYASASFGWAQDSSVIYYSHGRVINDTTWEYTVYSITPDGLTRTPKFTKTVNDYVSFACVGERGDGRLWFLHNPDYQGGPLQAPDAYSCNSDGTNLVAEILSSGGWYGITNLQLYGTNDPVYWTDNADNNAGYMLIGKNSIDAPAPPNDNFSSAIELIGTADTDTQIGTENSTIEVGESEHLASILADTGLDGYNFSPLIDSTWYKWTAPSNGFVYVDTFGSYWLDDWGWNTTIIGRQDNAFTTLIGFTGTTVDNLAIIDGVTFPPVSTAQMLTLNQQNIETDLTGFTNNITGVTMTRSTDVFYSGTASLKLDNQSPNYTYPYTFIHLDGPVLEQDGRYGFALPVPSADYVFTAQVYSPTEADRTNIGLDLYYYDADGVYISGITGATLTSTSWVEFSTAQTSPVRATSVVPMISVIPTKYQNYGFYQTFQSGTGWVKQIKDTTYGGGNGWELWDSNLDQIILPTNPGNDRWVIDLTVDYIPMNPANTGKLALGGDGDLLPTTDEDGAEMSDTIVGPGQLHVRGIVNSGGNKDILFYTDTPPPVPVENINQSFETDTAGLTGAYGTVLVRSTNYASDGTYSLYPTPYTGGSYYYHNFITDKFNHSVGDTIDTSVKVYNPNTPGGAARITVNFYNNSNQLLYNSIQVDTTTDYPGGIPQNTWITLSLNITPDQIPDGTAKYEVRYEAWRQFFLNLYWDELIAVSTPTYDVFDNLDLNISKAGLAYIDNLSLVGSYSESTAAGSSINPSNYAFGGDAQYPDWDFYEIRKWYGSNADSSVYDWDAGNGSIYFTTIGGQTYYFAVGKYWTWNPYWEHASTTINLDFTEVPPSVPKIVNSRSILNPVVRRAGHNSNDNIIDARELFGIEDHDTVTGMEESTPETGEIARADAELTPYNWNGMGWNSMWWKWTAPGTGWVDVDLYGSDNLNNPGSGLDTVISAWTNPGSTVDTLEIVEDTNITFTPTTQLLTQNQQDIETDTTGFTPINSTVLVHNTSEFHSGTGSLEAQITENWQIQVDGTTTLPGSPTVTVFELNGNDIEFSGWCKSNDAGQSYLYINLYDINGNHVLGNGTLLQTTTDWQYSVIRMHSVPGVVYAGIQLIPYYMSTSPIESYYYDDLSVNLGTINQSVFDCSQSNMPVAMGDDNHPASVLAPYFDEKGTQADYTNGHIRFATQGGTTYYFAAMPYSTPNPGDLFTTTINLYYDGPVDTGRKNSAGIIIPN